MADLKDTQSQHAGLMSAVRDIMMKNQNLYQQDLEAKYGKYTPQTHATPDEVEAATADNTVEVPDPVVDAQDVDPETVIPTPEETDVEPDTE